MIKLFWFSRKHLGRDTILNFGDELSPFIVQKLSSESIQWIDPREQSFYQKYFTKNLLAVGSILHFGSSNSNVWGSGLISSNAEAPNASYFATRGKYTRSILLSRNFKVPEVYGDPALLLPKIYPMDISTPTFKLGIIPHYVEYEDVFKRFKEVSDEIIVIDLRDSIKNIMSKIKKCSLIISSSLHGIIVPQAYNIPTLRVEFSDKIYGDGIKYRDYFDSVGIPYYEPINLKEKNVDVQYLLSFFKNNRSITVLNYDLDKIQDNLLKASPFL